MNDGLVDQIAGMDIREQQNVGVALDLAVRRALMLCSLRIDGQIQRKRSVHDASGDFAFFIHFGQFRSLYGDGHLGIDHLHGGKRSHLRIGNAAGMGYLYGVFDDMYLVLQRGIGHEGHVREEQKLFDAGNIKYAYMGKRMAGPKANLLVENAL